jgi:two-component system, LytTR family, response regulator
MNCILVDDDIHCITSLDGMLRRFAPQVTISGAARTIRDAVSLVHAQEIDLVFLDIEMQQESGFDLFGYIPQPRFEVIFTTAHEKYAVKAIRSSCFDYLLKPVDAQELVSAVTRLESQRKNSPDTAQRASVLLEHLDSLSKNTGHARQQKMALPVKNEIVFVAVGDIICLEGDAKYTTLYLRNGQKLVSSRNIGEFEELLDPSVFFRCHRSWIVNLEDTVKFLKNDSQLLLTNQLYAEVSTRKKDEFLRLFNKI